MRQIYTTEQILKLFKWLSTLPKERLPFIPVSDDTVEELLMLDTDFSESKQPPDTFIDLWVNIHGYVLRCRHGRLCIHTCENGFVEMYILKGVKKC